MLDLKNKFKENLINKGLIQHNDKILLGISGGPDSLTMLDLFNNIKDDLNLNLLVFHLNHSFRKEADQEAAFVKNFCKENNIKNIIKKYDVPGFVKNNNLSPEEGARKIRFKFFKEIYEKENVDKVSLAHNKDDLVETVLFNIFRGTGLRGLKGIEDKQDLNKMELIHPILIFYRSEILYYCKYNNLTPVIDSSNDSNLYSRNRIRNIILPMIEEQINSNAKQVIVRMTDTIKEDFNFLQQHSQKLLDELLVEKKIDKYILQLEKIRAIHPAIIKRIINIIISNLKGSVDNFYYKHYNDIIKFIEENSTGDLLNLPDGINLKISYNKLFVYQGTMKQKKEYKKIVDEEGKYSLPYKQKIKVKITNEKLDWRNYKDTNYCLLDYDKVKIPLVVRNRKKGDKFIPLGMQGHKKVKDYFIDEKVPDYKRDEIPIIFDNTGTLIWICGMRMDERFKVDKSTKKLLLIKYIEED